MVKSPSYSGTFDPTGSPVVVIKQGENELGRLEAALDEANELYQANWHTNEYDLSTDGIYRLSVQVEGYELGFADVDMVENGAGLRHVQSDSYIGLVTDGRRREVQGGGLAQRRIRQDCFQLYSVRERFRDLRDEPRLISCGNVTAGASTRSQVANVVSGGSHLVLHSNGSNLSLRLKLNSSATYHTEWTSGPWF